VRDPVAVVLPILDPVDLQVDVPIVVDEVLQQLDRLTEVADGLDEEVEELPGALRDLEFHRGPLELRPP
jgi:hypothetical protein